MKRSEVGKEAEAVVVAVAVAAAAAAAECGVRSEE